jgi:16S rRNA (cytosine967-C5)-methyltransferase
VTAARVAAARILVAIEHGRTTLAAELERERPGLDQQRDRALLLELTAGTLRWREELDALVASCAGRAVTTLDAPVRAILRLGAYQLAHLDRIPAHAVVHESVELTRTLSRARATGFVNAVLRRLARGQPKAALPARPRPDGSRRDVLAYLTTTLSHPRWLVERWLDRYGFDATEQWCRFDNEPPVVTLRSNGRMTREEMISALAAAGVTAAPARWVSDAVQLSSPAGRLPASLSDEIAAQDEASQLIAHALGATPGERILDVCAAPGGKTAVVTQDMSGRGLLVASDHRPSRVRLLRGMLARAGVRAALAQIDATRPLPFGPVFDAVLLDVPCSGLGTLRRDPDVKWARTAADLPGYAATQRAMLAHAAAVVRPGGRLLYATCSSEPEENEGVVDAFLHSRGDFALGRPLPVPAVTGGEALLDARGHLRTLPFRDGLDAFYAALLVRRRAA